MKFKICSKCGEEKPITQFVRKKSRKDGYCSWCKLCYRLSANQRYAKSIDVRSKAIDRATIRYYRLRGPNRLEMLRYLKNHSCVDCEETHPATLQFDHVRGQKKMDITRMFTMYKWDKVLQEIAKCEVRCANCHAKKTALERDYYTADGFPEGLIEGD